MRKITLVLVTLAFAAGLAVAEDVIISVSGSASVEWGFGGQLIDNTGSFLDAEKPSSDFFSDGGDLDWDGYPTLMLTATVEDADGNVIVEAASEDFDIEIWDYPTITQFDREDISTPEEITDLDLDYINFPNVIPGVLGIKLMGPDDLNPRYTSKDSTSKNERILVNITPIGDALDATIGLLIKPDNELYTNYYTNVDTVPAMATLGNFFFDVAGTDTSVGDTLDENGWEAGMYLSWAASLDASYTLALGDEDEVTIGFAAIIDSAFTNGVYEPDTLVTGTDEDYEVFNGAVLNGALDEAVVTEEYGTISVDALSIEDLVPTLFDITSVDEPKELRTNEVLGRATIPVGVGIDAAVGGLTADVDFQMVLTEGKRNDALVGGLDLTDATNESNTIDFAPYDMPMYAMVDVGYELAMGDMTITPGVNFKYSSDYWNWVWDGDLDDWEWKYDGDVSGADFVGRPMSLDIGLDVEGIAGMIDVSISAGLALGDGDANHGFGILNGATPAAIAPYAAILGGLPAYTYTYDDTGVIETVTTENTLAELIDFWYIEPTREDPYGGTADADTASDGLNNMYFAAGASAMDIEVGITVTPLDGLTIENTTTYMVDNLGIEGADDNVLFGTALSTLANETVVEYEWMVGDATAFTIFGELTYESNSYETEMGQKYIGLRGASEAVSPEVFEFNYSEAPSMATFDYAFGVKVEVGL